MFTVLALLTIYFTISFLRQRATKTPYAQRLIFLSAQSKKIGYSAFYNSNTDSTIIILLSGTIIAQTSLPGHRNKDNMRIFLEKQLFRYHGDLSKFSTYKNLSEQPL